METWEGKRASLACPRLSSHASFKVRGRDVRAYHGSSLRIFYLTRDASTFALCKQRRRCVQADEYHSHHYSFHVSSCAQVNVWLALPPRSKRPSSSRSVRSARLDFECGNPNRELVLVKSQKLTLR